MKSVDYLRRLPPMTQKGVACAALVVVLTLLWFVIVGPTIDLVKAQVEWRSTVAHRIANERGWIQQADAVQSEARSIQNAVIWSKFYGTNQTEALPIRLSRDVNAIMTRSGANSTQTEVLPVEAVNGLQRAALRVSAQLSIDQLKNVLTALNSHSPYLRVDQLHVSAPQMQPKDSNARLSVSLDVLSYSAQLDPRLGTAK